MTRLLPGTSFLLMNGTLAILTYPLSYEQRFPGLAWLLAFTKSFAWLVCRVVGLFTPCVDFVNAKSHTREKPLLAG